MVPCYALFYTQYLREFMKKGNHTWTMVIDTIEYVGSTVPGEIARDWKGNNFRLYVKGSNRKLSLGGLSMYNASTCYVW